MCSPIRRAAKAPQVVLMSSGSEVGLIVKAHQQLAEAGNRVARVSMPSMELFERQTEEYRRIGAAHGSAARGDRGGASDVVVQVGGDGRRRDRVGAVWGEREV